MNDQLNNDLATYRTLTSETDKAAFLQGQKAKIAQMSAEERKEHLRAIDEQVKFIAHRVEEVYQIS